MWYVLQVRTGTEENIRTQCRNIGANSARAIKKLPFKEDYGI